MKKVSDDTKIIFFTKKTSLSAEILKQINLNCIPLEAIFIDIPEQRKNKFKNQYKELKRFFKREGFIKLLKRIFIWIWNSLFKHSENWRNNDYYYQYSDKVIIVNNFNEEKCENMLKNIDPDLVILGGSRILKRNVIRIPKIGILNAHPGLLPKYRGVDVIPWAILKGDDVGVSIHFVDEEIDTGEICLQEVIPIHKDDTFESLIRKSEIVSGKLMVDVIKKIITNRKIETIPNPKEKGKQYHRMSTQTYHKAKQKLIELRRKKSDVVYIT